MTWLARARLEAGPESEQRVEKIVEWLTAQLRMISSMKTYQIFTKINRANARFLFGSLLLWIRKTGYPGLVTVVDARRLVDPVRTADGTINYTMSSLLDSYEVFRQFIDATDEFDGSLFVVLISPEFLDMESRGRGIGRYPALMYRVYDEVRDRHLANPLHRPRPARDRHRRCRWPREGDERMSAVPEPRVSAQRALEALRNGVPNHDAVRALGCMQPEALDAFTTMLNRLEVKDPESALPVVGGTLIVGGFGAGKSHALAYLEQEALRRNFVVSKVVVSKETPLHDLSKVYLAAVREARLPDSRGALLHELALRLDYRSNGGEAFSRWARQGQPYGIVAATVAIHEASHDPELLERVVDYWSGEKLGVREVSNGLQELGLDKAFDVRTVRMAELAPVRFEFAGRLARAVGFAGWVLLFDEVELVARYSLLQRSKAYAEIARWIGGMPGQAIPGVGAVAAITDDLTLEMFANRNDRSVIPERLRLKGDPRSLELAAFAESGMDLLDRKGIMLHPPSDDSLKQTFKHLRDLYQLAYGYSPRADMETERGLHQAMRSYVRRWISNWDLERLYPTEHLDAEEETLPADYTEDPELGKGTDEPEPSA